MLSSKQQSQTMNSGTIEFLVIVYIIGVISLFLYLIDRGVKYDLFRHCKLGDYMFVTFCVLLWPIILLIHLIELIPINKNQK